MIRSMPYAGAALVGAALALTAPGPGVAGTTPAAPYTVVLPTGDQVTLADPGGTRVSVKPGPGRAGRQFAVVRNGASVYVLPRDTMAQVGAGAVDRRQFDVMSLVRARYRGVPQLRTEPPAPRTEPGKTYELTIRYLDRTGSPTQDAFAAVTGWDANVSDWPAVDAGGTSTVRLPQGRYNLGVYLGSGTGTALLTQPVVNLTRNLTVTVDARTARPVTVSVPESTARPGFLDAGFSIYPSYQSWPSGMLLTGDQAAGIRVGQIGAATAPEKLVGSVAAQWAEPDGSGDFTDSPYFYAVAETFPGRVPSGFSRAYRARDFVAVQQEFAGSGRVAQRSVAPSFTPRLGGFSSLVVPTTLPGKRMEHYQIGVAWTAELSPVE